MLCTSPEKKCDFKKKIKQTGKNLTGPFVVVICLIMLGPAFSRAGEGKKKPEM